MGRVARYKKTKSFDRQTKRPGGSGEYIWGDESTVGIGGGDGRRKKKRSITAEKLHLQKLNRRKKKKQNNVHNNDGSGGELGLKSVFDQPPSGKDDFDLTDSKFTVKRQEKAHDVLLDVSKKNKKKKVNATGSSPDNDIETKPIATITHDQVKIGNHTFSCTIPETDADERRISRMLNLNRRSNAGGGGGGSQSGSNNRARNGSSSNASELTKLEGRREGESITKFNKRLREETKMALLQDKLKSRKKEPQPQDENGDETKLSKTQRRKEYLNEKKRRKKNGGRSSQSNNGGGDDDGYDSQTDTGKRDGGANDGSSSSSFITGERASFLDQAERPPIFKQLPRGAAVVPKKSKMAGVGDGEGGMNESEIQKEQDAMEALRKKVVAQYAMVRTRRRMEAGGQIN